MNYNSFPVSFRMELKSMYRKYVIVLSDMSIQAYPLKCLHMMVRRWVPLSSLLFGDY